MIAKTLHGSDFAGWSAETAELLRQGGRFDEIDIGNVAEEIGSLGDSQVHGARSQLWRMLTHWIKQKIHSRNAMGQLASIDGERTAIDCERTARDIRRNRFVAQFAAAAGRPARRNS